MVLEFHGERVFLAVAVVDAKHLEQVLLVTRQINADSSSFSVNRHGVRTVELSYKAVRTILVVVEVNEIGDGENIFRSERIGFTIPRRFENGHGFLVAFLSNTLVSVERCLDAADTV